MEQKQTKLVIASKVKSFVRERAGMNTSASVMDALSQIVEKEIDSAIENAKRNNRRTIMDRDVNRSAL